MTPEQHMALLSWEMQSRIAMLMAEIDRLRALLPKEEPAQKPKPEGQS